MAEHEVVIEELRLHAAVDAPLRALKGAGELIGQEPRCRNDPVGGARVGGLSRLTDRHLVPGRGGEQVYRRAMKLGLGF